ncbi:hypothetical protein B9Z55_025908 [Caenorhabditis nigoni]|uniref:Uncharacterized protein n=1 Tax=Caenorhabditis nigoni TaxID=1611254 RepID=A0A2G5T0X0_9PELO|nr:hypothetical protein B9Z55_025908 [Caenorhabditis nigoni]
MASSTSNIFHNTEERARTAEEEEEKTAGDRRGSYEHPHSITAVTPSDGKSSTTLRDRYISRRPLKLVGDHDDTSADDATAEEKEALSKPAERPLINPTIERRDDRCQKRYSDEPLMKVNTKPTTSSTTPLTATSSGENFNNGNGVIISQDRIRVRYMSGATRPLKALPLPEGWTERRRLQKNYARYPRIELLFNIIIHILSVQYSKTSIVLNVTK